MNKKTDYAWAAGVIDGEGCIFIARQKPGNGGRITMTYRLCIKVTMGHLPTIMRLSKIFGFTGSRHKVCQIGWNPAYSWIVAADLARNVLEKIKPYAVTKKKEISVAFEFLNLPKWYGGQFRGPKTLRRQKQEYRLWNKMRMLKPRTRFKVLKNLENRKERKSNAFHPL